MIVFYLNDVYIMNSNKFWWNVWINEIVVWMKIHWKLWQQFKNYLNRVPLSWDYPDKIIKYNFEILNIVFEWRNLTWVNDFKLVMNAFE